MLLEITNLALTDIISKIIEIDMPTTKKTTKKTEKKKAAPKREKKTPARETAAKKVEKKAAKPADSVVVREEKEKYFEAVGRRKTSIARVRLFTQSKKGVVVNNKPYTDYFPVKNLQKTVVSPMEKLNCLDKFGLSIKVKGGGITGQAEACRHGIARAFVALNPYFKKRLKKAGFLTRDPRMRERKKPGLKRARRAPQWSKR